LLHNGPQEISQQLGYPLTTEVSRTKLPFSMSFSYAQ